MYRLFANPPLFKRLTGACAVVVLACSLTAKARGQGGTLFLLTGTFLNDAGQTFPVRLYTVSADHKLKLFWEVVSGQDGLYEALDDTGDKIYVAFPYNNGVSQAPTTVSVIDERYPRQKDKVMFNPNRWLIWDRTTATAVGGDLDRQVLFTLTPPLPPGVQPSPAAIPVLLRLQA